MGPHSHIPSLALRDSNPLARLPCLHPSALYPTDLLLQNLSRKEFLQDTTSALGPFQLFLEGRSKDGEAETAAWVWFLVLCVFFSF